MISDGGIECMQNLRPPAACAKNCNCKTIRFGTDDCTQRGIGVRKSHDPSDSWTGFLNAAEMARRLPEVAATLQYSHIETSAFS